MARMFTQISDKSHGSREIRVARVSYFRDQEQLVSDLEYWPPTAARPSEGRISRVHESPELGKRPPREGRGRVLVVLQKFADGTVWCSYAYEADLRDPGEWPDELRLPILSCIDFPSETVARGPVAVQGYIDLAANISYCHGPQPRAVSGAIVGEAR